MDKSIMDVIHQSAKDLHDAELLSSVTIREFDALCLPPVEGYGPVQIRKIRTRNNVSQAVFAACMNTSVVTVRKWEATGETHKRPDGPAMKLLNMVDKYGIGTLGASDGAA